MPLFGDDCVGFPVTNAGTEVHDFGALLNGYPIFYLATPLCRAITFAPFLLAPQMGVKVATVTLICTDVLIDPRGTDTRFIIGLQVTVDLFWAPILADQFFNLGPCCMTNLTALDL